MTASAFGPTPTTTCNGITRRRGAGHVSRALRLLHRRHLEMEPKSPSNSAAKKVTGNTSSASSWYRYATMDLGPLYLATSGDHTLTVRLYQEVGGAVMNLKAVILVPDYEGEARRR